jgi:hypothetical protein
MRKKVLSLVLALVFLLSMTSFALAEPATGNTQGDIIFEEGRVTITPPDECCHCYGDDPCDGDDCDEHDEPCDCPCHDVITIPCPDDDYREIEVSANLHFGTHSVDTMGIFDSANAHADSHNTTDVGEFTGVLVRNATVRQAVIYVSISEFEDADGYTAWDGFELELIVAGHNGPTASTNQTNSGIIYYDSTPGRVLTMATGSLLAAWSGVLETFVYASAEGNFQATLTWTEGNLPSPEPPGSGG